MGEDEAWQARISHDPKVQGGRAVILGTRVPLDVILGALAGGTAEERVCSAYGISPEDVKAALAYAAALLRRERAHAVSGG